MLAVFLFDSDDAKYDGYYGWPITECVLGTGILQAANYPIEIAHGELQLYRRPELAQKYLSATVGSKCLTEGFTSLKTDRLRSTALTSRIYAWVLRGIIEDVAAELDMALRSDSAYLGAHEVDSSKQEHKVLLIDMMLRFGRLHGKACTLFYSSLNGNERDEGLATELLDAKLVDRIDWEDECSRGVPE